MERIRIVEVDIMRGLAVVCMIIGHSIIRYPVNISELEPFRVLEYFIFTFHMELFFVLAGYVYHCEDYRNYIVGKIKRIAIPYCVFGIINALLHTYGGSFVNGTESIKDSMLKFLFQGGEYWFLYTIFIVYAVFPLLEQLDWRIMCVVVLCCTVLSDLITTKLFCIQLVLYHLPFFCIGYMVRHYANKCFEQSLNKLRGKVFIIPLFCLIIFSLSAILYTKLEISAIRTIRALSVIVLIYYVAKWINTKMKMARFVKVLCDCSKYSLQVYLFNGYLLVLFRELVCGALKINSPILIILVLPILILSSSLLICKVIERSTLLSAIVGIKQRDRQ